MEDKQVWTGGFLVYDEMLLYFLQTYHWQGVSSTESVQQPKKQFRHLS